MAMTGVGRDEPDSKVPQMPVLGACVPTPSQVHRGDALLVPLRIDQHLPDVRVVVAGRLVDTGQQGVERLYRRDEVNTVITGSVISGTVTTGTVILQVAAGSGGRADIGRAGGYPVSQASGTWWRRSSRRATLSSARHLDRRTSPCGQGAGRCSTGMSTVALSANAR
ncbi:hypothetical protein [Actinomadura chokoriensis]|uniref:hypothetical protein n=1 Tax=Actinomadura chokoriensis TaxID=454156 RepID=UPI0031F831CB